MSNESNDKKIEMSKNEEKHDRFSEFMFGSKFKRQTEPSVEKEDNNEINYLHIMEQIDSIMTSVNELKPVLSQLSPIINFIKKKK